jgi:hypothetical protein
VVKGDKRRNRKNARAKGERWRRREKETVQARRRENDQTCQEFKGKRGRQKKRYASQVHRAQA